MSTCYYWVCDAHRITRLLATRSISGDKFGLSKDDEDGRQRALSFMGDHIACGLRVSALDWDIDPAMEYPDADEAPPEHLAITPDDEAFDAAWRRLVAADVPAHIQHGKSFTVLDTSKPWSFGQALRVMAAATANGQKPTLDAG